MKKVSFVIVAFTALGLHGGEVRVGAIRWDAWYADDSYAPEVTRTLSEPRFNARLPFFAEKLGEGDFRIDGRLSMAREIDYAADAGVDYFAFLTYPTGKGLEKGLDLFLSAPNRRRMHFALILHDSMKPEEWPKNLGRWIAMLSDDGYLMHGDRPIVFVYGNARHAFPREWMEEFRHAAEVVGKRPYFVSASGGERLAGTDAVSAYAHVMRRKSTYGELVRENNEAKWFAPLARGDEIVPHVTAGWDKTPRQVNPVFWERNLYYHKQKGFADAPTPDELAAHLASAVRFVVEHPAACPSGCILIYAWNEFDEGGWICPTWTPRGPDASRLDAIRRVLSPSSRPVERVRKGEECTAGVMSAVRKVAAAGGGKIVFEPGVYCFSSSAAARMDFHVSNHDQPPFRAVQLPIVGARHVVMEGRDTVFRFSGETMGLLLMDTDDVTIRGIRFEWADPEYAEGRIVGIEDGRTRIRVEPGGGDLHVSGGRLFLRGDGWERGVVRGNLFDCRDHGTVRGSQDVVWDGSAESLGNRDFLLGLDLFHDKRAGVGARPGDVFIMRDRTRPEPAICLYRAKDTLLEDVVICGGFGMGLLAQRSENVTFRGTVPLVDREGRGEELKAGAFPATPGGFTAHIVDATHFSNCRGKVLVENARFARMLDDAINVHATCLGIVDIIDARRIRCRYMHRQSVGFEVFAPGERLRFIKGPTLENGPIGRVEGIVVESVDTIVLTLEGACPAEYGVGDAVENADWFPDVVFRGNWVGENRPRGALFTTTGEVLCESNVFRRCMSAAIHVSADAQSWYETGACPCVHVRGNLFDDCQRVRPTGAVIVVSPEVIKPAEQRKNYHGRLVLEGNEFRNFGERPIVYAASCGMVEVGENMPSLKVEPGDRPHTFTVRTR